MNANLAVIADNLDYLLWGRLAEGQPGGVALTLLMAIGATLLALPGGIALAGTGPGATAGWCGVCCFCGWKLSAASR